MQNKTETLQNKKMFWWQNVADSIVYCTQCCISDIWIQILIQILISNSHSYSNLNTTWFIENDYFMNVWYWIIFFIVYQVNDAQWDDLCEKGVRFMFIHSTYKVLPMMTQQ